MPDPNEVFWGVSESDLSLFGTAELDGFRHRSPVGPVSPPADDSGVPKDPADPCADCPEIRLPSGLGVPSNQGAGQAAQVVSDGGGMDAIQAFFNRLQSGNLTTFDWIVVVLVALVILR